MELLVKHLHHTHFITAEGKKRKADERESESSVGDYFFDGVLEDVPDNSEFCKEHPKYDELIEQAQTLRLVEQQKTVNSYLLYEYEEKAKTLLMGELYYYFVYDEPKSADADAMLRAYFQTAYDLKEYAEMDDWDETGITKPKRAFAQEWNIREAQYVLESELGARFGKSAWSELEKAEKLALIKVYIEKFGIELISDVTDENFDPIYLTVDHELWDDDEDMLVRWYFRNVRRFRFDEYKSLRKLPYRVVEKAFDANSEGKTVHPLPHDYFGLVPISITRKQVRESGDTVKCMIKVNSISETGRNFSDFVLGELDTNTWKIIGEFELDGKKSRDDTDWEAITDGGEWADVMHSKLRKNIYQAFPVKLQYHHFGRPFDTLQEVEVHILWQFSDRDLKRAFGTVTLTENTRMYHADDSGTMWYKTSPIRGPAFFACNVEDTAYFGEVKLAFFVRRQAYLLDLINDSRTRRTEIGFEPYGRALLRYAIYGTTKHHNQLGYSEDKDAQYLKQIGIDGWFSYDHGNVKDGEFMLCKPEDTLSLYAEADDSRLNWETIDRNRERE